MRDFTVFHDSGNRLFTNGFQAIPGVTNVDRTGTPGFISDFGVVFFMYRRIACLPMVFKRFLTGPLWRRLGGGRIDEKHKVS